MIENKLNHNVNTVKLEELLDFLIEVDSYFSPKLSNRVNLNEWAAKLRDNATTFEMWDDDKLVATIIAYINDYQTKQAYITLVCCKKEYQRKCIIKQLFQNVFEYCKSKHFETIVLKTDINNISAINLYKDLNFIELALKNKNKVYFIKRLK